MILLEIFPLFFRKFKVQVQTQNVIPTTKKIQLKWNILLSRPGCNRPRVIQNTKAKFKTFWQLRHCNDCISSTIEIKNYSLYIVHKAKKDFTRLEFDVNRVLDDLAKLPNLAELLFYQSDYVGFCSCKVCWALKFFYFSDNEGLEPEPSCSCSVLFCGNWSSEAGLGDLKAFFLIYRSPKSNSSFIQEFSDLVFF